MNVYGEMIAAQLETFASDPATILKEGRIGWRTDSKKARVHNGTSWIDLSPVTLPETQFTVANNQATANVTGLLFSSATYRGAIIDYDITRKTDTASSEKRVIGRATLFYRVETATWELQVLDEWGDGDHGVTLTVTAAGQIQYATTNIAGANYVGKMNFMARTFNA